MSWPTGRVFLKVDTQGSDMAVIRGCGERLVDVQALQREMSVRPVYEGQVGDLEALAGLRQLGFVPVGFFTFLRDEGLRLIDFDDCSAASLRRSSGTTEQSEAANASAEAGREASTVVPRIERLDMDLVSAVACR